MIWFYGFVYLKLGNKAYRLHCKKPYDHDYEEEELWADYDFRKNIIAPKGLTAWLD